MVRLATRASPLALWQARHVASLLESANPGLAVELLPVRTTGDRQSEVPVWEMGGRGVFVGELQAAVLAGRADAAVHSAKDLQPIEPPGLCLAAVPERADPRDALVGARLAELGPGAVVATGSQRRRAQLAALVPGLVFKSLRGNISTRLDKVPPGGAVVMALAALQRLGLQPEPLEVLSTDVMLPQVAQGAIGVECRAGDERTMELLSCADDASTRATVEAERAFLAALGGGCDLPVAAYATWLPATSHAPGPSIARQAAGPTSQPEALGRSGGRLSLTGLLAAADGSVLVRQQANGPADDPASLGQEVARAVLAAGGEELLASFRESRP